MLPPIPPPFVRGGHRFDNRFVTDLPGDPLTTPVSRVVEGAAWSRIRPTPVREPGILAWSSRMARELGLPEEDGAGWEEAREALTQVFAGNALFEGMDPWAACYGGHQFGNWAGQLGDGRAISLGELVSRSGARWELQLKGAGPTPYSRRADGRAVLRSSIREFLCSEAMHGLGIPTTRALSLVTTGEEVVRDLLYDGNPREEPGAIVCRASPSFIRFGTFELPASRGDLGLLEELVRFTVDRDFPHLSRSGGNLAPALFLEVAERTAHLMAQWMSVGFVHGVMNTDNLSILGLTIDYGPYGWLDYFDPGWTPNTTDAAGRRYRFGAQPQVAQWNLARLAEALLPVSGGDPTPFREALDRYVEVYEEVSLDLNRRKLGLPHLPSGAEEHRRLLRDLFPLLVRAGLDHTLFFRTLARVDPRDPSPEPLEIAAYSAREWGVHRDEIGAWLRRWGGAVCAGGEDPGIRVARMNRTNPGFILRNWIAQTAIDEAEAGAPERIRQLLTLAEDPWQEPESYGEFGRRAPDWAFDRPGCSMLSCSS